MDFDTAVAQLDQRTNYERTGHLTAPTLERIEALLDMLAHPERGFPVIHITGTNGKTTTARAATEVLRAAGLKVATYTSPHVSSIRERFHYDGEPIPEEDLAEAWRELAPYLNHFDQQGRRITWFEAATALAFVWFADKAVEAAVIEVGMGGSWDATNVVHGDVAVFSPIGVDHPQLGATPAETAREKAGIIKEGSSVVSLAQPAEVREILQTRAHQQGSMIGFEPDAFELEGVARAVGGQVLTVRLGDRTIDEVTLPLYGEHAARDALLGAAAAHALIGDISADVVRAGLADVRVPGRMEVARRAPLVVLDGAHNPGAARALAEAMPASFQFERLTLVISIMSDKDIAGVLDALLPIADHVVVTRNSSPRAADPEQIATEVRARGGTATTVANVADALSHAIQAAGPQDAVLVTGSLYTVGDARAVAGAR